MSVLFKPESRSVSYQQVFSTGGDLEPFQAGMKSALKLVPVYAATNLIADSWAASPWAVYDKSNGVPSRAAVQPSLVADPGVATDVYSWRFQAATSCLLRGNAYGQILDVDSRGVPSKVRWLHPDNVEVDESGSRVDYFWKGRLVDPLDMIHVPMYVLPGSVVGLSPVGLFKLQLETGQQAQQFGRNYFKRGTVPAGWLKFLKGGITTAVADEAKRRFLASVSSSEPMVSGNDWDYTPITVPAGDAQFLAGINATANQIAAVYRVAPEDVGGKSDGSSLTYKNLEQDQIRFAVRTVRPLASRFEAVFNKFLPVNEYIKTNLDAGARADLKTRYEAHQIALTSGFKTDDEVRALEELAPLTDRERQQILQMKSPMGVTP